MLPSGRRGQLSGSRGSPQRDPCLVQRDPPVRCDRSGKQLQRLPAKAPGVYSPRLSAVSCRIEPYLDGPPVHRAINSR
jgi:hypothetical protein